MQLARRSGVPRHTIQFSGYRVSPFGPPGCRLSENTGELQTATVKQARAIVMSDKITRKRMTPKSSSR